MIIIVNPHDVKIKASEKVNKKEYNITKCEFEFSEEYTDDLVKVALFTNSAGTYKQYIVNNECNIPAEILEKNESTILGVYSYKEENEELVLRYSPEPIKFFISKGSYIENAENSEPITPTDKEQIEQAIVDLENDKQDKLIAGDNITIEDNVISATDTIYDDSEIREDISELENDKVDKIEGKGLSTNDYTTDEKSKLASLENYDDTEVKEDIADLETNKADRTEIPDVSNFVTKSVADLVNYYLKSETYTKEQVNDLISAISTVDLRVVEQLPTQDISTTTIYLVPKVTPKTNDVYDEYIYVSNDWEHIGSTEVDLTDYVKNTDYGTANKAGVLKQSNWFNIGTTGFPYAFTGTYAQYENANGGYFIGKGTLENVIAGKNLVSNTDYASTETAGVAKVGNAGISINPNTGLLYIAAATPSIIAAKSNNYLPIVPRDLDYAVKTGITTNTITLTSAEKEVARSWLGLERSWKKIRTVTIPSDDYKGQTIDGVFYNYVGNNGIKNFSFTTDSDGNTLEGKGITGYAVRITPTTNVNINQMFIGTLENQYLLYQSNIKNTTTVYWFEFGIEPTYFNKITNNPGNYHIGNMMSIGKEFKSFIFNGFEDTSVLGEGSVFDIWAYGYWD